MRKIVAAVVSLDGCMDFEHTPFRHVSSFKFYRNCIRRSHIIVGRNAFQSSEIDYMHFDPIVLSSKPIKSYIPVVTADSMASALRKAGEFGNRKCYIVGGCQTILDSIPFADELWLCTIPVTGGEKQLPMDGWTLFARVTVGGTNFERFHRTNPSPDTGFFKSFWD